VGFKGFKTVFGTVKVEGYESPVFNKSSPLRLESKLLSKVEDLQDICTKCFVSLVGELIVIGQYAVEWSGLVRNIGIDDRVLSERTYVTLWTQGK